VYLILIIVPIFLFQAVLIDFARVKLAEKESATAAQAAVRSVMSAYDNELQTIGLYGLGIDQDKALDIFQSVFTNNLSGSVSEGAFHFIKTEPINHGNRLTPVYTLANHTVFKRQILEDMKFKAPIEFALEITDKFKKSGASSSFNQGSQFAKEAEALEKLIDKRDEELDEAWHLFQQLRAKVAIYHSYYASRLGELSSLASEIGLNNIDEIKANLLQIRSQLQSLRRSLDQLNGTLSSLMNAGIQGKESIVALLQSKQSLENEVSKLISKQNDLERILGLITKYIALVAATKLEASANQKDISSLQQAFEPALQAAKKTNDELRLQLKRILGEQAGSGKVFEAFQSVKLLEDDYFHSYQTSVGSISALFSGFESAVGSISLTSTNSIGAAESANEAYANAMGEAYTRLSQLEQERNADRNRISTSKREQRNKIQAVLDQAKQAIGGCRVADTTNGDAPLYARLQAPESKDEKGLYQTYLAANAKKEEIGSNASYELDKPDNVSLKAMSMLETFTNAAEGVRDELFLNEFALTKFNYRTYGLEKDSSGKVLTSNERFDPGKHPLASQEVEYLLYGFSSCLGNVTSAYGEMFSFRLAIRTLEAFMDPKNELLNVGSPLLVLLVAAAEGAVQAFQDMHKLVNGERVELSAKLASPALSLSYKDYLRIFLLLHSNNSKLMARMQALIELNTGRDLREVTTYLQGHAESSVRLWFIPGMMKLADGMGILGCDVKGKGCVITETSVFSY
jgi:hypothetical protein